MNTKDNQLQAKTWKEDLAFIDERLSVHKKLDMPRIYGNWFIKHQAEIRVKLTALQDATPNLSVDDTRRIYREWEHAGEMPHGLYARFVLAEAAKNCIPATTQDEAVSIEPSLITCACDSIYYPEMLDRLEAMPEGTKLYLSPTAIPQEAWISVDDRLPDGDCFVDVYIKSKDSETYGSRRAGVAYISLDFMWIADHHSEYISHWMPLPSKPKCLEGVK